MIIHSAHLKYSFRSMSFYHFVDHKFHVDSHERGLTENVLVTQLAILATFCGMPMAYYLDQKILPVVPIWSKISKSTVSKIVYLMSILT